MQPKEPDLVRIGQKKIFEKKKKNSIFDQKRGPSEKKNFPREKKKFWNCRFQRLFYGSHTQALSFLPQKSQRLCVLHSHSSKKLRKKKFFFFLFGRRRKFFHGKKKKFWPENAEDEFLKKIAWAMAR